MYTFYLIILMNSKLVKLLFLSGVSTLTVVVLCMICSLYTDNICITQRVRIHTHNSNLILNAAMRQTAGINLQTDLGDEDACIQNSFDVLQPA